MRAGALSGGARGERSPPNCVQQFGPESSSLQLVLNVAQAGAVLQRRRARCARAPPLSVSRMSPLHTAFAASAGRGRGRGWVS
eukprot:15458499-Alexandrium_andersonii.AAC.1